MSDANRVALRYVKEATWGTTPTSGDAGDETLREIRFTSESLRNEPSTTTSQELRSDRQTADLILTDLRASGSTNFELSFASHDWALASLFQQTTYTSRGNNANIAVTITASTGTIAGTGVGTNINVGDLVYVSGTEVLGCNVGLYKVTAAAADSLTVTPNPLKDDSTTITAGAFRIDRLTTTTTGTWTGVNSTSKITGTGIEGLVNVGQWIRFYDPDSGSSTIHKVTAEGTNEITVIPAPPDITGDADEKIIVGAAMSNGTTFSSYTIEREYADITTASEKYVRFVGATVESMDLTVAAQQVTGGSFNFLAKSEASGTGALSNYSTSVSLGDGNTVMNAINHVQSVFVDDASYPITSLSLNYNNNLRARPQVGTLGAASIGSGTVNVSGQFQAYYATKAQFDKFINQQDAEFAIVFEDVDQNGYVIEMPRIKYSAGQRVGGGQNTDVIADLSFQAIRDATDGFTIRLWRFDA